MGMVSSGTDSDTFPTRDPRNSLIRSTIKRDLHCPPHAKPGDSSYQQMLLGLTDTKYIARAQFLLLRTSWLSQCIE
jgi:hypothetical protein